MCCRLKERERREREKERERERERGGGGGGGGCGGERAAQAPYDGKAYCHAMSSTGRYDCGGNLFWHNIIAPASPGVPIRRSSVEKLQAYFFATPDKRFPLPITISCPSKLITVYDPEAHKGGLRRVSPEEVVHAYIFAVAFAIQRGAPEEELLRWRTVALTATFSFKELVSEDTIWFEAIALREAMVTAHTAMGRTALQRCFEIIALKTRYEAGGGGKLASAAVQNLYVERARLSDESEPVSAAAVDAALTIHRRALSIPAVLDCIKEMEGAGIPPLNSIFKLQVIVQKARSEDNIVWCFQAIRDKLKSDAIDKDCLTMTALGGGGKTGSGRVAFVDLLVAKRALKCHMLGEWLNKMLPSSNAMRLRKVFDSHESYRKHICGYGDSAERDLTWAAAWPPSALQLLQLVEARSACLHNGIMCVL